jgi:uncharacterized protein (TIGR02145 family)
MAGWFLLSLSLSLSLSRVIATWLNRHYGSPTLNSASFINRRPLTLPFSALSAALLILCGYLTVSQWTKLQTMSDVLYEHTQVQGLNIVVAAGTGINVNVNSDTCQLSLTPSTAGTLTNCILTANIKTSNSNGYIVYLSSDNNTTCPDQTAACLSGLASTHIIPAVGDFDNPQPIASNSWGFALPEDEVTRDTNSAEAFDATYTVDTIEDGNPSPTPAETDFLNAKYALVPTLDNKVKVRAIVGETTGDGDDLHFYFAVKSDYGLASGEYGNTLRLTVEANKPPTMQEITDLNCPIAATGLEDTRDGHYYLVQRMPDGKCWMLTNLAYGEANDGGVTTYSAGVEFKNGAGQDTNNNVGASADKWNRKNPPYSDQKQWLDPTRDTITVFGSGTNPTKAYATSASGLDGTEVGYLYNWCAALGSASGDCDVASGNIANAGVDLCPAGWRLPTGGATGDFAYLNGMMVGDEGGYSVSTDAEHAANWLGGVWRGVRAGQFNPYYGISSYGSSGYYWSGTAGASASANLMMIADSILGAPDSGVGRYVGSSVRCIANN